MLILLAALMFLLLLESTGDEQKPCDANTRQVQATSEDQIDGGYTAVVRFGMEAKGIQLLTASIIIYDIAI